MSSVSSNENEKKNTSVSKHRTKRYISSSEDEDDNSEDNEIYDLTSYNNNKRPKTKETKRGKVFIGSMIMRGKHSDAPHKHVRVLNVTSAQAKASPERLDLSPMSAVPGGYNGFYCFENYWQSGKVFKGMDRQLVKKVWLALNKPKRRLDLTKDKQVLYAIFEDVDPDRKYEYIASRKEIYVPQYYDLVKDSASIKKWKAILDSGVDVFVKDFDGPKGENGELLTLEVTPELLHQKINDVKYPFGHGYVVAAALLGLEPVSYTK